MSCLLWGESGQTEYATQLHTGRNIKVLVTLQLLSPWLGSWVFTSSYASLLSHVQLFATPWSATCQASLSFTISWSLLKLKSIESVMPSNHLILCCLLLLPSIFPSIRIISNESTLHIRWPKYWSFSLGINPSNEYSGLISFRIDGFDLSRVFSGTTVWRHLFIGVQPSLWFNSHIHTLLMDKIIALANLWIPKGKGGERNSYTQNR